MNINHNLNLLKPAVDIPAAAPAKDGIAASRLTEATATAQARQAPPSTLLPSTQGDFDAARVAEIRKNISAGRYVINTGKIADGLLATVRDLLSKPKS
jgi:negative regulator of flagellin synthesis FlgM